MNAPDRPVGPTGLPRLDDEACRDAAEFGGKAAGLAALAADGYPVAPGFAVGASAFREFLGRPGLRSALAGALADPHTGRATRRAGRLLASEPVPAAVATAVRERYRLLGELSGTVAVDVAVRSSATAEDSAGVSFAGEFETWVDVSGADAVLAHVRRCWSSVFSERAVVYARCRGVDPLAVDMAVVVQRTVRARAAGVMFTISPVTGDRSRIVIEAGWGLGLAVVGGEVTPDRWTVDKVGLATLERVLGDKRVEYRRGAAPVAVEPSRWAEPCLTEDEVLGLARMGKRIERDRGCPQDVEFAVDPGLPAGERLVLLQCRPETVWAGRRAAPGSGTDVRGSSGSRAAAWVTGAVTGRRPVPGAGGHPHPEAA